MLLNGAYIVGTDSAVKVDIAVVIDIDFKELPWILNEEILFNFLVLYANVYIFFPKILLYLFITYYISNIIVCHLH